MNAGRILNSAGYDVDAIRAHLWPIDPARVNVWPASTFMRALWRRGIQGITVGRMVFVHPDLMRGDSSRLARLVIHELVHVRQYAEQGYLPFTVRYLRDFGRGLFIGKSSREAYLDVRAEREAREVTRRIVGSPSGSSAV